MRAVIMGCGRVGSRLAKLLYKQGISVSVIDENVDAFRRLDPAIDVLTVTGTAIDEDVQRASREQRCSRRSPTATTQT
jgi:trk system potassium uptake protein